MTVKKFVGWLAAICVAALVLIVAGSLIQVWRTLPGEMYVERTLGLLGTGEPYYRQILVESPDHANVCVVRVARPFDIYEFCKDPGYAGQSVPVAGPGMLSKVSQTVTAPDGQQYYLQMWSRDRAAIGAQLGIWITFCFMLGWVSLAIWVFADGVSRGSKAAVGWLFLTLMTGPIGLAVWLVARGEAVRKPLCPGCGADVVQGTIFCVKCGQPLHPTCPDCGRRVELDWAHCGACGASLSENGGGDPGLLAHEDGA